MQKNLIYGPDSSYNPADTHKHKDDPRGVVVYTEPLIATDLVLAFLRNETYGIDADINAEFGGAPIPIHDGEDTSLWTGSSIAGGKFTFDSTDRFKSGAQSVKTDNAAVSDIMQFDNGSDQDLTGYVGLSLYINVDKDWAGGDSIAIYGYDTGGAVQVGDQVLLEDYFTSSSFDTWHPLAIPFSDMALTSETVDAFRIEILSKQGKSPKFYIDDFQIEETGQAEDFIYEAPTDQIVYLEELSLTFVMPLDTTLADASMPNFDYATILGASLTNGIGLFRQQEASPSGFLPITSLFDFLQGPQVSIREHFCDKTNTFLKIVINAGDIQLDGRLQGKFIARIQDDLSGFTLFRMLMKGRSRPINEET